MTLEEYKELSAKTCPDLGSQSLNILHMNMGLYTEIGEVIDIFKKNLVYGKEIDLVHLGEELADCEWYNMNKRRLENKSILIGGQDFKFSSIENICQVLLELVLKHEKSSVITKVLMRIAEYFELDYFKLLGNNIAKLKARYGDKFSTEKALNRDLEKERAELEK